MTLETESPKQDTYGNHVMVFVTVTPSTVSDPPDFSLYSLSSQYLVNKYFICNAHKSRSHFTCLRGKEKKKTLFNGPHYELLQEKLGINLSVTHKTAINMIVIIQNEPHQPFTKNSQFI